MTVSIEPALRSLLSEETLAQVAAAAARGPSCMICATPLAATGSANVSVVALREIHTGETLLRFAHPSCSPSRIIDVPQLPESQAEAAPAELTAWAIAVRERALPTIVLAWDLAHAAHIPVGGQVLLDSLRLDGMSSGAGIEEIVPACLSSIAARRESRTLCLTTPHGTEYLELGNDERAIAALSVAARQRQFLLVVGVALALHSGDLDEVDRALQLGEAIAATVNYADPELAAQPRRRRRARRLVRQLIALTPTARRSARHRRAVRPRA